MQKERQCTASSERDLILKELAANKVTIFMVVQRLFKLLSQSTKLQLN